jgi:hypothetical protein
MNKTEKNCLLCHNKIEDAKSEEIYVCDCNPPHAMYKKCMERNDINECPFAKLSSTLFGGPMIETFRETPTGLMFHENSCFLSVLLQIFLSSDSQHLKNILLRADPLNFNYAEDEIDTCEKESIYGHYSKKQLIRILRTLAINLQSDFNTLIKNSQTQKDQTCTMVRETLAICMRSVFGHSSLVKFKSVDFIRDEWLGPIYTMFRFSYRNLKKDAEYVQLLIGVEENHLRVGDRDKIHEILGKFFGWIPAGNNAFELIVNKFIELSMKHGMVDGAVQDPVEVYKLFCAIFPPLMVNFKWHGQRSLVRESSVSLFYYVDGENADKFGSTIGYLLSLQSLINNPLIVFNNNRQYRKLSESNIDMRDEPMIVNRPLAENILLAGVQYGMVAMILHNGKKLANGEFIESSSSHYTAHIRHKRIWYYFDDNARKGTPRFLREGAFPKHALDATEKAIPVLFFYARSDYID